MATGTLLYDDSGNKLSPKSDAECIEYNTSTVKDTLDKLVSDVTKLKQDDSGVTSVNGQLTYNVSYKRTSSGTPPAATDEGWSQENADFERSLLPDDDYPYLWKRSTFKWKDNDAVSRVEIVTTSLYPQVRYMYTVTNGSTDTFEGPPDLQYGNVVDDRKLGSSVKWHSTPQSVTSLGANAYMVMATRSPGQDWSSWSSPAMYGSYALSSVPVLKFYVSTSSTAPSGNNHPNSSTQHLQDGTMVSSSIWKDQVSVPTTSGTYYIYSTTGVKVGGTLTPVYGEDEHSNKIYWSDPILISIFNK